MPTADADPRDPAALAALHHADPQRIADTLARTLEAIDACQHEHVWISRADAGRLQHRIDALVAQARKSIDALPLLGVPFAVKDNIDAAGLPTTAACPAFAYTPASSAAAVARLEAAGAVVVGKTNLDQFATGLVGTRSPHGACRSVYHRDYISGGSSSGSAVAVAAGLVPFSLGTDTAGSGRVPAAMNGIVGLKPTPGRVPGTGVVPACRSIDTVSVFAHTSTAARLVLDVIEGPDPADPFSRAVPADADTATLADAFTFAVPGPGQLQFLGDADAAALFAQSVEHMRRLGGRAVEVDITPLLRCAELLYGSALVAERDTAVGGLLDTNPAAVHPVVRAIVLASRRFTAADAFRAWHEVQSLRRDSEAIWSAADVLLLPTVPTVYRVDEVLAEPFALNANLGRLTNFANLLGTSAVAVPVGMRRCGVPHGVTLFGPAFADRRVLALASRLDRVAPPPPPPAPPAASSATTTIDLAVVGAHLSGMPLNHQLTAGGGVLQWTGRTTPRYRLYALANTTPPKPGLVHVGDGGAAIEVEVWSLPVDAFGRFVAAVPPPLAIGSVELADGRIVKGFVCEPRALEGAADVTAHGGWRAYIRTR